MDGQRRLCNLCAVNTTFVAAVVASMTALAAAQPDLGTSVRAWVASHQRQVVTEIVELLSIPNIAADKPNIRHNADHLVAMLRRHGLAAELLETDGNPLVLAALLAPSNLA